MPTDLTVTQLLGWILGAIAAQVALGAAWAWQRTRAAAASSLAPTAAAVPTTNSRAAWPGLRAFRVQARRYEDAAQTQCSFELVPVDGQALPPFLPGQFLTFVLQLPGPAGAAGERTVTRCYSLSDQPRANHYRVTIKRVPSPSDRPTLPPGLSSNHFHEHVQVGDTLQLRAPAGHFFIHPDPTVPVVLIAGGIGITPMMSMLQWCVAHQPARAVHLFYGVRQGAELAFKAELQAIAAQHRQVQLHLVFSRPAPDEVAGTDDQHTGHVDLALLQRCLPHGRHAFYLCGPPALMESLVPALAAWGVPESDLHFEAFGPASVRLPSAAPATGPAAEVEIRFQRSGRTLAWDGQDQSLLDFAERQGVAVEFGCRSGGCGSCETQLLSGTVAYAQTPDHDVQPGHCLLCVGRPTSALVLEA